MAIGDKQHPLGSGFTASSTVDDVLDGVDLSGRNVVVTGGHSGLGLELTRALGDSGAEVTIGARDPQRASSALSDVDGVHIGRLDLMDPASIDAFVREYLDSGRPLHILLNNAGLPLPQSIRRDARGFEAQFATNHLGHFQLTTGLLRALRAADGARVVNTTSGAQRFSDIHWDDPMFETTDYDAMLAYAQSKTANVLFAVGMDARWADDGIRGYAAHPGVVVGTGLNSAAGDETRRAHGLVDDSGNPIIDPERGKKTAPQGASTIAFGAVSPLLADIGGVYLKDNDISPLNDEYLPVTPENIPAQVASHSIDPDSAQRLWRLSEELLAR